MNSNQVQRQSNIELLRIVAMLGVIILHYNNSRIGGGFCYAKGVNQLILYVLESIFACAVNLFILISGYFMCKSSKRTMIKPLELIIQVILFKEVLFFIKVIIGKEVFSVMKLLKNLVPANWFVVLYCVLYLISPTINVVVERMVEKKIFRKVVALFFVLFSVYPTVVDILQEIAGKEMVGLSSIGMYGSQWGYTIVNFSLMYLLGAYIRNIEIKKFNSWIRLSRILLLITILVIWAYINDLIGFGIERTAWEYCNPFVILIAIELFMLFKGMDIGNVKLINTLAKGAFTVFLLHNSILPFVGIERFVKGNSLLMLMHIVITTVAIYCLCWCAYEVYEFVTRPIYNKLCQKIPALQKIFLKGCSGRLL